MTQDVNSLNSVLFGARQDKEADLKRQRKEFREFRSAPNPLGVMLQQIGEDIKHDRENKPVRAMVMWYVKDLPRARKDIATGLRSLIGMNTPTQKVAFEA